MLRGEPDQFTGRVLNDRYRLTVLYDAHEGSSEYLAHDLETGDRVSVKILNASISEDVEFSRRLAADTATAALVSHPFVEQVLDWGRFEDRVYVVTEYFPGIALASFLEDGYQLTASQAIKLGFELATGLSAIHDQGLSHGDVSPANVILGYNGYPKLSAIYLTNALVAAEKGRLDMVGTGFAGRSSDFVAPETALGLNSPKSDVYSLAATLTAVIGNSPVRGSTSKRSRLEPENEETIEISEVFGSARVILEAALTADPAQRSSASALAEGLAAAAKRFVKPAPVVVPETLFAPEVLEAQPSGSMTAPIIETEEIYWRPVWKLGGLVVAVLAVLSVGAAWAVSSVRPQGVSTHLVERYEGRTIGEVRAIADSFLWVLDEDQIRTDELPSGIIVAQWPSPGSRLAEGDMLIVEVASGPRLRMTPLVLGLSTEVASARLEAKGFEVDLVQPVYDENVAAGQVLKLLIDSEPVLGGRLREPGTRAVLVVSGGPVPRTVPQLVGLTRETAREAIDALQLTIAKPVNMENSESVDEGVVIRQDLAAGLLVDRGSPISITISAGPDRREVPDMRGLSVLEAERRLAELGLVIGEIDGSGQEVQGSEPPPGSMLQPGSPVALWVPSQE
ncbi:MAG: hypothetical protein CL451_01030 [Acidimicrobiaceae bacterium]|nr:hypothetical protein [Acidimicrobiaceae bacterium]